MEPELGSEIECVVQLGGTGPDPVPNEAAQPESNGSDWINRVRPSEVKGFAVYTRCKRLKSRNASVMEYLDNLQVSSESLPKFPEPMSSNGEGECKLENLGFRNGVGKDQREKTEYEVKEEELETEISSGPRRFTRSVLKSNVENSEMENGSYGDLGGNGSLEAGELETEKLMELKMSEKILVKGRLTTVRELFETGLLEGYPVFYNGGKRGFPLRGTIKDSGILCFCSLCKGAKVVPLCQFEIHACKSYRRASQYICLDNGKSLLDVLKDCRKSSLKTLEETIQNIIGPLPVKESIICRNCEGSFLATSAAKVEMLCDSCMIIMNSEVDAECVKSRDLKLPLGLTMSENGEVLGSPQNKGRRGRKKGKHPELKSNTKSTGRPSLLISRRKRGRPKKTKMPSEPSSATKSPGSALMRSATASASKYVKDGSPSVSMQSKSLSKITKKDQRMHKLVFENGGLPDGTEVAYYSHGKKLRDGYKMGLGIICSCCSTLVSPSQFEAHAGWAARRRPYMYIYTSNGVSLHEFAISLLKGRSCHANDNDDLCIICADGGKLVLCDGCPRAFHKECASLSSIPRGKWFCTYCENMFQREKFVESNDNAIAAGRVSGIDSIEQITNRCVRIVKNPEEAEVIACIICRGYDFSKSGFGPRTVILCDQCEKEYHVGCLKKSKMADLKELPKGKWFCSGNCKWMYSALHDLLNDGAEKIPDSCLDVIKKKLTAVSLVDDIDLDVRWRLLNGKSTSRETRVLLSQAVAIFHECFGPIVDSETGRDFIPSMVYGRNIRGQDFSGMYCAILTVNSTVVSAGILRIFGQEMAELPLAATRIGNQGKGYFQILYSCIEKLLAFLNVKSIVLPATDDAKSIWTKKFGFEKIPHDQLFNYRKICWQMITFKGTSMLEKSVPKCRIVNHDPSDSDVFLH